MIFTFWEGKRPAYIELCFESWNFDFVLLTFENLRKYTDLPIERLKRFTLPQIADCVRVHVLRDNGGTLLDADTIVLGKLPNAPILGYPETRGNTIGFLNAKANEQMYIEWAKHQERIINSCEPPLHWSVMGNDFTDDYLREHTEIKIGDIKSRWPETYMVGGGAPRMNKYKSLYFGQSYYLKDFNKTDLLMLHNSWTPDWYKELTREEVLRQNCTLSNILNEIYNHGRRPI